MKRTGHVQVSSVDLWVLAQRGDAAGLETRLRRCAAASLAALNRALNVAAHNDHADAVVVLLAHGAQARAHGAEPQAQGAEPQAQGAQARAHGPQTRAQTRAQGAQPQAQGGEQLPPLFCAAADNSCRAAAVLLRARADIYQACGVNGFRFPNAMALAATMGHVEVLALAVASGFDARAGSPLHFAATAGHADVIKYLVGAKACVHQTNAIARDALMVAVLGGHGAAVDALLAAKANVHHKDARGRTALELAASDCGCDIVDKLLAAGADVEGADVEGSTTTPLIEAAMSGCAAKTKRLLRARANVRAHVCRAMYFATVSGHSAVVALLLRADATAARQTGAATAAQHAVSPALPRAAGHAVPHALPHAAGHAVAHALPHAAQHAVVHARPHAARQEPAVHHMT